VDFAPRGVRSRGFGSRQFPDTLKENKIHGCKHEGKIITVQAQNSKGLLFIADIQASLIQSSQKACSAQIGDE
jgi:hypothetical protein